MLLLLLYLPKISSSLLFIKIFLAFFFFLPSVYVLKGGKLIHSNILILLFLEFLFNITKFHYWNLCNYSSYEVMLEKTLENPLDCKEIQAVHPKGDQSWVFIGRTDAKAETPILWPLHAKSWLIGKDSDAGRDWGQEEKGTTEDEMAGWHHWLNGHEFEWTPGIGDGQGGLECCDSWGHKESDRTERLNWTELN